MSVDPKTPKRTWKQVHGLLLLDKPRGLSSNAALQRARRLFSAAKAGHTGTLDPLAEGLLLACFGEATKFSAGLLDADKTYEATLRFGTTTTTGDAEGDILEEYPVIFSREDLETVLSRFHGKISQLPPMYSALKHDGQPLYKLARKGMEVERMSRQIIIHSIELIDFSEKNCKLRIECSKGTYIRTLAEDIGKALDSGAHLSALRRTHTGSFSLQDAFSLEAIEVTEEAKLPMLLKPVDSLLQEIPHISLDQLQTRAFVHGNPVMLGNFADPGSYRVYCHTQFLGTGTVCGNGTLRPRRLLSNAM